MILECVTWTTENDHGYAKRTWAKTVEDCRDKCLDSLGCTAIDWIDTTKLRIRKKRYFKCCRLVGRWSPSQRHTIDKRSCG